MHSLLERQERLHAEATILLTDIVLPILKNYGKSIVGGSYSYNLLYQPDLDIDVLNGSLEKDLFIKLCTEFLALQNVSKFKSADRVVHPHTHGTKRPFGYWISPEIHFNNTVWTLDIWFQKPKWYTGDTSRYAQELSELSEKRRITILSLKEELIQQNLYGIGKKYTSVDVYEAVLRQNIETVAELYHPQ